MNDLKSLLLKILEAIEYTDDKEAFTEEFEKKLKMLSLADLIKSLPEKKQEQIKKQLTEAESNPENATKIVNSYFSTDKIQESIKNTTRDTILEYIQTIMPTLSPMQEENLMKILKEIGQSAQQVYA